MATSITDMAAKVTADMSGFRTGLASGKNDITSFRQSVQSGGAFKIPGLDGIGSAFKGLAGSALAPIAGIASVAGVTAMLKELSAQAWQIRDDVGDIGVSTTLYQALGESARLAGEDINTVGMGIVRMHKIIGDAATGSKEAEATLAKLGLTSRDLVSMTTEQQLQMVAEAIAKVGNTAIRTSLEMELFGKAGKKLDDILKDVASGNMDRRFTTISAEGIDALADASQGAGTAWKFFKSMVGEGFGAGLGMLGFGRTAQELAQAKHQEEQAAARTAEHTKQQADETARLKSIEEARDASRKRFADFSASMDKQLAQLSGGDSNIGTAGKLKNEALQRYLTDIAAIQQRARDVAQNPIKTANAETSALKQYQDATTAIDAQMSQLAKLTDLDDQRKRDAAEIAQAQAEAAAATKALMTDEEKRAAQLRKIAEWQRMGAISGVDADRMRQKASADFAGPTTPRDVPVASMLGSIEEYSESLRMMNEAKAQAETAKEEVAKEQLEETKKTNETLQEIVDVMGAKPAIWKE